MIGVTNLRGGLPGWQIGRPQSVIGVANFEDVRQWKAPKCDRGHEFQLPPKVGWEEESINRE